MKGTSGMQFAQPAVTAPVVGPRSQEQLGPARRAPDVALEELTFVRIDEFSPVHRTAPADCA
jgi:hypothetical protein